MEVVRSEEVGDDGVEEEGAEGRGGAVGLGNYEINIAGVLGAAAVGAADCHLDGWVEAVDGGADEGVVAGDFGAGDALEEIVVVSDTDVLVFGQGGFGEKIV